MNNKALEVFIISLLLISFLGIVACATPSGSMEAPSTPSYSPEENDPNFWDMWESAHGLG